MRIVRPVTIASGDLTLVSSNVPETPPAAWSGATTYALGDTVSALQADGYTYKVYESLQGSNLNNAVTETAWWLFLAETYGVYSASTVYTDGQVVIQTSDHHEYESLVGANAGTVTITIASPGVVTLIGHGLAANTPVLFTTTGALPTGLSVNTIYYVRNATTDTFELSETSGGASINTSGTQSGTHTLYSNPNKGYALTDTAKWLDLGSNNRHAMFDNSNSTQTECGEDIVVVLTVDGRADAVSVLNMVAATVRIVMTTALDGTLYDETHDLVSDSGVNNWYEYFFEPIIRKGDLVVYDLPSNADPTFTITISDPGATAKVGALVIGQHRDLGPLLYGARTGIQDYSRKEADDFGNFTIIERAFAKRAVFKVVVDNDKVDALSALLATYRATAVVWIGSDDFTSTWIYGFYKDFSFEIAFMEQSYLNLELEGLT